MKNSRLVYSTEQGRIKSSNEEPILRPESDGFLRIRKETKGRNGKGVTVISGFDISETELKTLTKALKQLCGTGGTLKDFTIEIQGDQREKLKTYLEKQGHKVKLAGG